VWHDSITLVWQDAFKTQLHMAARSVGRIQYGASMCVTWCNHTWDMTQSLDVAWLIQMGVTWLIHMGVTWRTHDTRAMSHTPLDIAARSAGSQRVWPISVTTSTPCVAHSALKFLFSQLFLHLVSVNMRWFSCSKFSYALYFENIYLIVASRSRA